MTVSFFVALGAGVLSFASPCVLPLVPAYLGYLGGQVASVEEVAISRRTTFLHGIFFVLGFSVIFVALGAAASGIGRATAPAFRSNCKRLSLIALPRREPPTRALAPAWG